MNLEQILATNVRRFRNRRRFSQEELAGRCGLSARHIGSIERGTTSATIGVINQIAEALEVEAWKLFLPLTSQEPHPQD
jgi:transcriptional regulator with XRE-family HTH domain